MNPSKWFLIGYGFIYQRIVFCIDSEIIRVDSAGITKGQIKSKLMRDVFLFECRFQLRIRTPDRPFLVSDVSIHPNRKNANKKS